MFSLCGRQCLNVPKRLVGAVECLGTSVLVFCALCSGTVGRSWLGDELYLRVTRGNLRLAKCSHIKPQCPGRTELCNGARGYLFTIGWVVGGGWSM